MRRLPNRFAELYPAVRELRIHALFRQAHRFGRRGTLRSHLARPELQEAIANYLAGKFTELTIERRAIEFDEGRTSGFRRPNLSVGAAIFHRWRRPRLCSTTSPHTTISSVVSLSFSTARRTSLASPPSARLSKAKSGSQFRVDYLKPSGAIGFYHPDWLVVQKTSSSEVNLVIETKGRVWEDTAAKDAAIEIWCDRVTEATGQTWRYARINQRDFHVREGDTLTELMDGK